MINQILNILHERGPLTLAQLSEAMNRKAEDICELVAAMIICRDIHLEKDGTLWYAREVAA